MRFRVVQATAGVHGASFRAWDGVETALTGCCGASLCGKGCVSGGGGAQLLQLAGDGGGRAAHAPASGAVSLLATGKGKGNGRVD